MRYFVVLLVFAVSQSVLALTIGLDGSVIEPNDNIGDYTNIDIDSSFADDRVLVVLSNEASLTSVGYDEFSFPEISCSRVSNLTQAATEIVFADLYDTENKSIDSSSSKFSSYSNGFSIKAEEFNQVLCVELLEPGKENVVAAIKSLSARSDIIYAGPDYEISLFAVTPNDPYYNQQSALSKIQLPQAWSYSTGSASITVGVLDSGIDGDHPDLVNNINTSLSRNFVNDTYSCLDDPNGHGTHVAGIIAARGNNALGVAGVAWNIKLASLRAFNSAGTSYSSIVANAINYATSNNIQILNFSAGWSTSDNTYDQSLESVIRNYPGLFVCAAGNAGRNNDINTIYPANYRISNLISVGSSTSSDTKVSGSNYGKTTIDIFAPGQLILSCFPINKCENGTCDSSTHYANGYHKSSGTSMAASLVTGVAALIRSKYPTLSAAQIKERIMATAEQISSLSNYCVSGGRLNAYRAVHSHSFTVTSDAIARTQTCYCGYVITERHTYVSSGSGYVCSKCGQTTGVLPYSYTEGFLN